MKKHRCEPETKTALLAGVVVVAVWFAWAWIGAPFFQGRIQAAYEAGMDQAVQANQRVPPPPPDAASGAPRGQAIAHRSNVHIEVPAQTASASGAASTSDYFARLGQTGDLYGGANALFASLALVAVGWAGALQQRTMREARETDALEWFEGVFFELLKLSREVVEGFERKATVKGKVRTKQGYSALNGLAAKLFKSPVPIVLGDGGSRAVVQRLVNIYKEDVYRKYPSALGPYFRLLFQTFQLVSQAPLKAEEKVRYANIARGQISEGAVLLLALNGLTWRGRRFVRLIEEFGLLEHMHHAYLSRYKMSLLCAYREKAFMGSEKRAIAAEQAEPKPGPLAFDRAPDEDDFQDTRPPDDEFYDTDPAGDDEP